jgi:hypothetical protein
MDPIAGCEKSVPLIIEIFVEFDEKPGETPVFQGV